MDAIHPSTASGCIFQRQRVCKQRLRYAARPGALQNTLIGMCPTLPVIDLQPTLHLFFVVFNAVFSCVTTSRALIPVKQQALAREHSYKLTRPGCPSRRAAAAAGLRPHGAMISKQFASRAQHPRCYHPPSSSRAWLARFCPTKAVPEAT